LFSCLWFPFFFCWQMIWLILSKYLGVKRFREWLTWKISVTKLLNILSNQTYQNYTWIGTELCRLLLLLSFFTTNLIVYGNCWDELTRNGWVHSPCCSTRYPSRGSGRALDWGPLETVSPRRCSGNQPEDGRIPVDQRREAQEEKRLYHLSFAMASYQGVLSHDAVWGLMMSTVYISCCWE